MVPWEICSATELAFMLLMKLGRLKISQNRSRIANFLYMRIGYSSDSTREGIPSGEEVR